VDGARIHFVTLADLFDEGGVDAEAAELLGVGVARWVKGLGGWLPFAIHGSAYCAPRRIRRRRRSSWNGLCTIAPIGHFPSHLKANMIAGGAFGIDFFARPCLAVAPELVGAYLVHRLEDGTRLVGRIVEVEAYLGGGRDPGSHAHRGPTPRNRVMFGAPGRLYVYRSYGIHTCANVVCEPKGRAAAVLLRALEPVEGFALMHAQRGLSRDAPTREIANGPGKLCQALGITLEHYGRSLLRGSLSLRRPAAGDPELAVASSRRIGLSRGVERRYRFYAQGNAFVSRSPR
jgi:DNA-3-methyladenine glycosylase